MLKIKNDVDLKDLKKFGFRNTFKPNVTLANLEKRFKKEQL